MSERRSFIKTNNLSYLPALCVAVLVLAVYLVIGGVQGFLFMAIVILPALLVNSILIFLLQLVWVPKAIWQAVAVGAVFPLLVVTFLFVVLDMLLGGGPII